MPDIDVIPGRGQILVTKPIKGLKFKGICQFDEGYYYFRNQGDRIIFGGGRNLDFQGEQTYELKTNEKIVSKLKELLREVILPGVNYEVDYEWAGVMAFGEKERGPLLKQINEGVFAAVRCFGMGVALSSNIGETLAENVLAYQKSDMKPKL